MTDLAPIIDERADADRHAVPGGMSQAAGASPLPPLVPPRRAGAPRNRPVTAEDLREIARAVRRIGRGRGASPEAILIEKSEAAERLFALAARLEAAT